VESSHRAFAPMLRLKEAASTQALRNILFQSAFSRLNSS
jgi:hypothetical protein